MIKKSDIQDIYGLSPMQESMIVNHVVTPEAYIEQFDFRIKGEMNETKLEQALEKLVEKYEILRTVYSYRKTENPMQVVLHSRKPELIFTDIRNELEQEEIIESIKESDRNRGFDLSKDILIRGHLIQITQEKWSFIFTFHHIVMDGWSLVPLIKDLFNLYEKPEVPTEQENVHPYSNYIRWLETQDSQKTSKYWRNYLANYLQTSSVGMDKPVELYIHDTHKFMIPKDIVERLVGVSRENNITLNTILQTAWGVLLQKINYTNDVMFGNVVSGRPPEIPGIEAMVGLFINTLPMRVTTNEGETFNSLCRKIQKQYAEHLENQHLPLFKIQSESPLKNKLIDHVIAFENYPLSEQLQQVGQQDNSNSTFYIEDVHVYERSNYDFNIIINPGTDIFVTFIYNINRYSKDMMERIERSWINLLDEASLKPDSAVDKLKITTNQDQNIVLREFQQPVEQLLHNTTIDNEFRKVAREFPDNVALSFKNIRITYKELDYWSDVLANRLIQKGIRTGSKVGLIASKSPESIASIIGILKTGASYVPLETENSKERLSFIIKDAAITVVCTNMIVNHLLPDSIDYVEVDIQEDLFSKEKEEDPTRIEFNHFIKDSDLDNQAYLMYTSGSTGKPKGCKISHRNILNLVYGQDYIDFGPQQTILQTVSLAFDPSTFDIWGTLLHGGTLVQTDERTILDTAELHKVIEENKISVICITTSLFNRLVDAKPTLFKDVKYIIIGGEVISISHVSRVMEINPLLNVINGYGPTENTTMSTTHLVTKQDLQKERIPIGRPLRNRTAYVVDKGLNILPVGCIGELCVGGEGVSIGYHNRPELTEQFFLKDPFTPFGKMYRTGDLVRWLPDGTLDYCGRIDSQVKVRGYRIELAEIENAMAKLPYIKQVAVQVRNIRNEKQLCAYYTATQEPDITEWRSKLSELLPNYMIPYQFIKLSYFSLTVNGKLDYSSLPDPELIQNNLDTPSHTFTGTERKIAEIFSSVLGINMNQIGLYQNFFELGANSLTLIKINTLLKEKLNQQIPITILFEKTSIYELANYLKVQRNEHKQDPTSSDESSYDHNKQLKKAKGTLVKTKLLRRRMEDKR